MGPSYPKKVKFFDYFLMWQGYFLMWPGYFLMLPGMGNSLLLIVMSGYFTDRKSDTVTFNSDPVTFKSDTFTF